MTLSKGTVLQERYRIVQEVGRGGFGAVYRAWHMALNRPVAVKENLDTSPEAGRQFEREAQLLGSLRHPNLPVVIDHFILPGQGQYLVMDFVEGKSLETILIEHGGPLAETKLLPWIEQVCSALTYLHSRQPSIIHRDIKPGNIIIADDRAMLVDFGISKVYDANRATTVGAKAVTPGLSPLEQYGRGRTDARSDLYALGATMYLLLTGQTPPEAPDLASRADVLDPLRKLNPAVSEKTAAAVMRAMALHADDRPASVSEFARALTGPVTPPPKPQPSPPVVASQTPVKPAAVRNQVQTAAAPKGATLPQNSGQGGRSTSTVSVVLTLLALDVLVLFVGLFVYGSFFGSLYLIINLSIGSLILSIVSRLDLGLRIASYTDSLIASAVIAVMIAVIDWLLHLLGISFGGLLGLIVSVIVVAIVLMIIGRFMSGIEVRGIFGVLFPAIGFAVIAWLIGLLLGIGVDANPTAALVLRSLF